MTKLLSWVVAFIIVVGPVAAAGYLGLTLVREAAEERLKQRNPYYAAEHLSTIDWYLYQLSKGE